MTNRPFSDRMSDYVPVSDRIDAFIAKYPEGSLQSEITHLDDAIVVVKAWAYRTPDDQRPGVGHSSLLIPGSTNFTRGSEIENAETSAWGRAIAALGFEVKRGIASREEVENKQNEHERPIRPPQPRRASDRPQNNVQAIDAMLGWAYNAHGLRGEQVLEVLKIDPATLSKLTPEQVERARTKIILTLSGGATPPDESANGAQ